MGHRNAIVKSFCGFTGSWVRGFVSRFRTRLNDESKRFFVWVDRTVDSLPIWLGILRLKVERGQLTSFFVLPHGPNLLHIASLIRYIVANILMNRNAVIIQYRREQESLPAIIGSIHPNILMLHSSNCQTDRSSKLSLKKKKKKI